MLDPEYLREITDGAEQIAEELHEAIISRIVERIVRRLGRGDGYILTAQDKWQLEVLRDAGFLMEDIQQEIAQKTRLQMKELAAAFEDAGVQSMIYDSAVYRAAGLSPAPLRQSPNLIRLVQRAYEATTKEWRNYTRTTANAAQRLFIQECDKAYTLVSSGAVSYSQAVREAVEHISADGVTVTYPSGHTDTIETATLRAVRTGISQACADITDVRMDEMNWDTILTSAHLGARVTEQEDFTNHYWWQGKFYSRSGTDPRFPPFSVCGMGDVQGIHGANCRHSHGPGDGENNPYEHFDSEENRKAYELSQRQRALERRIRKTKREVQGLKTALENAADDVKPELQAAYQKKAALLTKQNKAYNSFCEENGLKRLSDRLSITKWNRQQAAQAGAAAKRKAPDIPKREESDVTAEYLLNAKPGEGLVTMEDGYKIGGHQDEIKMANWLHDTLGGNIKLRAESKEPNTNTSDFNWNEKFWELKTTSSSKAAYQAIRHGLTQIQKNPGGVILDFRDKEIDIKMLRENALNRFRRSNIEAFDLMVLSNDKIVKIWRFQKETKK